MLKQNIFRLPCRAFISPRKDREGFTLSEILITLVLMGTVMALTIPSMTQKTNKNTYVAGLKKTYGMLDTATNQIMNNNAGTLIQAPAGGFTGLTNYCNILECNKTCLAGSIQGNCWASSTKTLSGGVSTEDYNINGGGHYGAILADGSFVVLYISSGNCTADGVSINLPYASDPAHRCGQMLVDVNGFKGPNTWGRDIFWFFTGPNGIVPGGDPHTSYNDLTINCNTAQTTKNGYGCAAKVLNEGAMNY